MLSEMGKKYSKWVVGGIIGVIVLSFLASDFLNGRMGGGTMGASGSGQAGTVNGEVITVTEFNRELARRMEFFNAIGGGKISEEQMKAFRIRESVFNEIVQKKLLIQAAEKAGNYPATDEIKAKIQEIPAFQDKNQFDPGRYREVLKANQLTPGQFEAMIGQEIVLANWDRYFKARAAVSDSELREEFRVSGDKRNIEFVLLTTEQGKRKVSVTDAELKAVLADAAKVEELKQAYEARKDTAFKGKTFESVRSEIARDLVASTKPDEIRKANQALADEVLAAMKSGAPAAKINSLVKPVGTELKASGFVSRLNPYLPGAGDAKELMADAFSGKLSEPKVYHSGPWSIVARVKESQVADDAKFEQERAKIRAQLEGARERALFDAFLKGLTESANVKRNAAIAGDEDEAAPTG